MYADIRKYVRECAHCQAMKPKAGRLRAPVLPRTPPSRAWVEIEMDFIPNLPPCPPSGYTRVATVVDTYSKMAIFIPCSDTMTTSDFAGLFIDHVYKRVGMPVLIRSDEDTLLTSALWEEIAARGKFEPSQSPPYRHEANGLAERTNQTLESFLRALIPEHAPDEWLPVLPIAEFLYNSTPSTITGISPFVAAGYREPRRGFGLDDVARPVPDQPDQAMAAIDARVRDFLNRSEVERANRIPHELERFEAGTWVWLSSDHITQRGTSQDRRLKPRFLGPFTVKEVIGDRTYILDLPRSMKIRNRIDIDRLKRFHGTPPHEVPELVAREDGTHEAAYNVNEILRLQGRLIDGHIVKTHAVVSWQGYEDETLEPLTQLVEDVPGLLDEYLSQHSGIRLEDTVRDALLAYRASLSDH